MDDRQSKTTAYSETRNTCSFLNSFLDPLLLILTFLHVEVVQSEEFVAFVIHFIHFFIYIHSFTLIGGILPAWFKWHSNDAFGCATIAFVLQMTCRSSVSSPHRHHCNSASIFLSKDCSKEERYTRNVRGKCNVENICYN